MNIKWLMTGYALEVPRWHEWRTFAFEEQEKLTFFI